jgi:4-aminobutyrate aminotransferase-like enzyme
LLLQIPTDRLPARTTLSSVRQSRTAHIGGNLSVSYGDAPLQIVRGRGAYLYSADGHRFIDAYNNVAHVGHCHPRVVRAVSEQLAVLNTNTRYLQAQLTNWRCVLHVRRLVRVM